MKNKVLRVSDYRESKFQLNTVSDCYVMPKLAIHTGDSQHENPSKFQETVTFKL